MSRNRYSEEEAVQKPAGELLRDKLGWNLVYAYDEEKLGTGGTIGRMSYSEVVLRPRLEYALIELNEWLSESDASAAVDTLLETLSTDTLLQTNEKKYEMLRDGIPVERQLSDGTKQVERAVVFDFEHPELNDFLAVEELWVQGPYHKRRCDLVGFVNGIPLMFVEFKRHDKDVLRAYEDNYSDYLDTIPQLFHFNAFVMLSNGLEAKVGTLGSKFAFFHEWKRLKEGDEGSVALETMLLGMCEKSALMDLFENFILFDKTSTPAAKILARNHQYLGVNEAIEAYANREAREGKLGVFWHTQGSGKSYSMVFFSRKVRRKFAGSPTFLVVTDRDELNKQIAGTFANCGCLDGGSPETYIATSGRRLREMLDGNPSHVFSLIQKFNDENAEPIQTSHDVIIMCDEAHRTNNGLLASNMVRMLPGAHRLGFTGTPLLAYDNLTARTFGGYVSVYDFQTAVDDGATVPLYYENRSELLHIDNPEINDELADVIEQADLDENQRAKLERDLGRELHIITAQSRLEVIAKDFVEHYTGVWESGKAMFVCVDKVTAVRMHDLVAKYWAEAIAAEKAKLKGDSQQEALERQRKISWMEQTEMAVVVSQEQNEIAHFEKWGIDIRPHREKMEKRELDKEFKDPSNPFRVVFVCAMWLTGFDVKSLAVMYFDKPLKAHTLMQAIARANRVCDGKSNGLIVDYIGIVKALRKALADYTQSAGGEGGSGPVIDKQELIARINALIGDIVVFLSEKGFSLDSLIKADGFERLAKVKEGADCVSDGDEGKKRFGIMARELFKLMKFVERKELEKEALDRHSAINAIYKEVTKRRDVADTGDIMVQLQSIIDEHVSIAEGAAKGARFDISKIDFDRLHVEFAKTKEKHLLLNDFREVIEYRLEMALRENPRRADFFKRYEAIIESYNKEQDRATIEETFEKLMKLSQELDEEQKSYVAEGFTNPQQQAVFDMLYQETLTKAEIKKIKELAIELVDIIQNRLKEMSNWTEKPETRAEVDILIRDELWMKMPESVSDEALMVYRGEIFNYFYTRFAA